MRSKKTNYPGIKNSSLTIHPLTLSNWVKKSQEADNKLVNNSQPVIKN